MIIRLQQLIRHAIPTPLHPVALRRNSFLIKQCKNADGIHRNYRYFDTGPY